MEFGSSLYLTEEEQAQLTRPKTEYYKYNSFQYQFWKKHNLLKNIGDFINNFYIKSSGDSRGTISYSGGTDYVYDPTEHKIVRFSIIQKLLLEKYYR